MLDKANWAHLIPHQGDMCLLERVVAFDDDALQARSATHRSIDNPLRGPDGLRALHLCEYGAQAMALHGGLLARRDGGRAAPGLLVSLRDVHLFQNMIDSLPGEIDVHAWRLLDAGNSWQYEFRIEHAGRSIATGRAAVMLGGLPGTLISVGS
ncbi:MAG: phosphotransferase [Tahibacter sp.]